MAYNHSYKKSWNKDKEESRKFPEVVKPLMTEEEKSAAMVPIDQLAFDFSCRVTRMYKCFKRR